MYSQIGVHTSNPQGTFHVDGAKDNPASGTPSAAQQNNDMVLQQNGNFGLGTTAPENKFHIVTTGAVNNRYTMIDAPNGTLNKVILAVRNTSPTVSNSLSLIGFTNAGPDIGGANWGIGSIRNQNNTNEDFFFGNAPNGNNQTFLERMRIKDNGYVGINTKTPENRFHIVTTEDVNNRYTMIDAPNGTLNKVILAVRNTSPTVSNNLSLIGFTNAGPNIGGANWGIGSIRNQGNTNEDFFFGNSPNGNDQTFYERMRIKDNGYVGINTKTPENRFHVVTSEYVNNRYTLIDAPSGSIDYPILAVRNTSTASAGNFALIGFANDGPGAVGANWGIGSVRNGKNTDEDFFFGAAQGGHYIERMRITGSGSVGIGTNAPTSLLSVNGTADKPGGGSWGTFSDKRVKKDIESFKDGLNVINQLRPVTYRYNEKSGYEDQNKQYVGFIAQEVEKVAPYMVNIIDDSAKSGLKDKREFDESALTKILVNAVQQQQLEINQLKKELAELKKKN
ncbi:tail fiber domain-containing protein [Chryseobacterium sp. 'Rf worker isolate 10']|uniref:tail fiber domain-containing protein n=1 Tax=Chryseobacterium sp. 'Rf worker isolate 10' TaxID=2887348 RepID=UPI003D6F339E